MARAALALTLLACSCGLVSRDYTVQQDFLAGGPAPTSASFNSTSLVSPLSADVSKVGSVSLQSAMLESLDQQDLSFVSGLTIVANGSGQPQVVLATLLSAPAAGVNSVQLQLGSNTDLKPYLQAGGVISATAHYSPTPAAARSLRLTLTIHGSLL